MDKAIKRFKSKEILVFEPGEQQYERSVATSNLLFRFSRPDCVVQPESAAHVQTIINEAKSKKLKITIKCNGHSYAGHSTAFQGISLDLRKMNKAKLDMKSKTATVDAGCQWGHVYETLINGGHNGFIINGGRCPTVGVGGFILGGGLGPFTRSFGMGCDTLMEASLVTANGTLVTVKKTDNPQSKEGRLFWALCGAGGGNFGLGVRFTIVFDGSKPEYDRLIDKNINDRGLKVQLKRRVLAEQSTRFLYETLVNQWLEETERAYPTNKTYELYSSFIFTNDNKGIIQKVTTSLKNLMQDFQNDFQGEQVNFLVTWIHSGGKATEKDSTDSAFFWREAVFHTYVTVEWVDKWMERDMRRFLAKVKKTLRPLSLNGEAAFINFPDRDFPTKSHERAYYGDNREELRRVKKIWDKHNFFKWDQGVRLPEDPEEDEEDQDDEDKTDQLAGNQWEYYKTTDILSDLNELADLGYESE